MLSRTCLNVLSAAIFVLVFNTAIVSEAEEKKPDTAKADDKKVKLNFEDHVKPIFRAKCFSCHNADKKSGGLDVTNFSALMEGGSSGAVIEPGDSSASYLFNLVNHESEPKMPPNQDKIPGDMLATISGWIDGGALETSGSKSLASNKPKVDLTLAPSDLGKPEGPAPMPERIPLEPVIHTSATTAVTALATSPWASLAAVAGQKQILLYNTETLQLAGVLPFPEGVPYVLKFSRNGALLLAGGGRAAATGKVVVYNVKTGERVVEVGDEYDSVLAADISADQSKIALGSSARVVRVFSTSDGELLYELKKHTDWICNLEFSPDGVLLATGDRNGGMFVWEAETGREYLTLNGHTASIMGLSWRADSNILASASEDATVKIWEMNNGRQVKSWTGHGGGTLDVEFSRNGRLVTCGRDKTAKLWDQNGQQLRAFQAFADLALKVSICDQNDRVIAGDWTGAIRVWQAADGTEVGQLTANPPTIAERIESTKKDSEVAAAELQKLTAAATAADDVLKKANDAVAVVNKRIADTQTALNAANQAVTKAQADIKTLTAQVAEEQKQADVATKEVATAKTSAETAKKAAADKADDKALAEEADKQAKALAEKTKQLETASATLKEKQDALTKANTTLAESQKAVIQHTATLDAARKELPQRQEAAKASAEKATAAKQALEAGKLNVERLGKELARWQDELAFAKKQDQAQAKAQ